MSCSRREGDEGDPHDRGQAAVAAHVHPSFSACDDRSGVEGTALLVRPVLEGSADGERLTGRARPGGQHHYPTGFMVGPASSFLCPRLWRSL